MDTKIRGINTKNMKLISHSQYHKNFKQTLLDWQSSPVTDDERTGS